MGGQIKKYVETIPTFLGMNPRTYNIHLLPTTMEHMPHDHSSEYPTAEKTNIVLTSKVFGPDRTYWTATITIEEVTFDIVDETKEDALDRMKDAIDILNSYAEFF